MLRQGLDRQDHVHVTSGAEGQPLPTKPFVASDPSNHNEGALMGGEVLPE